MSDERSGGGNGAVVAIVVVLAILGLIGVGVVGMGALLFVGGRQTATITVRAATPPNPTTKPQLNTAPVLAPEVVELPGPIFIEINANRKLIVAGEEMTVEKLKEKLQSQIDSGTPPRVMLIESGSGNAELSKQVNDLLQGMMIAYEVKAG